jgi:hypothetical protein
MKLAALFHSEVIGFIDVWWRQEERHETLYFAFRPIANLGRKLG